MTVLKRDQSLQKLKSIQAVEKKDLKNLKRRQRETERVGLNSKEKDIK